MFKNMGGGKGAGATLLTPFRRSVDHTVVTEDEGKSSRRSEVRGGGKRTGEGRAQESGGSEHAVPGRAPRVPPAELRGCTSCSQQAPVAGRRRHGDRKPAGVGVGVGVGGARSGKPGARLLQRGTPAGARAMGTPRKSLQRPQRRPLQAFSEPPEGGLQEKGNKRLAEAWRRRRAPGRDRSGQPV